MACARFLRAVRCTAIAPFLLIASAEIALAQATSPANPPPAPIPVPHAQPQSSPGPRCDQPAEATGGAGLVVNEASAQRKNWQPIGGEITFTVRSFDAFNQAPRPLVCFRWRTEAQAEPWAASELDSITLSPDAKTLRITVTVPPLPPPKGSPVRSVGIVPLADVAIVVPAAAPDGQPTVIATSIGISSIGWALAGAFVFGALMLAGLLLAGWRRLQRVDTGGKLSHVDPLLMAISSPSGYASLSQLQILLWTLVVAVSAVYVMLLSGDLIQITTGTLVLLGISGAATIGSKIHAQSDAAQATVALVQNHPRPLWSDLITNVTPDGKDEIDLTCVQMLAFTLITAVFVAIRVFTSYVIPDIPEGFQILMGISNSVYLGSKVAQRPPASTTPAPQPGA